MAQMPSLPITMPTLTGAGFELRSFRTSDADSLQQALNDPKVTERLTKIHLPYTLEKAEAWINQAEQTIAFCTNRISFVIDVAGEVAGSVSFINADLFRGNAQLSTWVAQRFWGQGLAYKALSLLIDFGFSELKLDRISAFHVEDNGKTKNLMKKLGLPLEAIHPNEWCRIVSGRRERVDSYHYAVFADQWPTLERGDSS